MSYQKNVVLLLWSVIVFVSCNKNRPGWKTIEMGNYLIDVPSSFQLIARQGIDSEGGELTGKEISFSYLYGAYTDTLIITPEEYIKRGHWRDEAIIRYLDSRKYAVQNFTEVKITAYRPSTGADSSLAKGCDYVSDCSYAGRPFNLPIFIPLEIKQHIVTKNTIQHQLRRIVRPKKGISGLTGVYIRDERGTLSNGSTFPALAISARGLGPSQQQLALEIFATLRPKPAAKK